MAGSMDLRREYAQSGTHVPERRPSGQRSLHSMRIPDRQDLVVRMSGFRLAYRGGRMEGSITRLISFWGRVNYRRFTVVMFLASTVAAVASILDVERGQR